MRIFYWLSFALSLVGAAPAAVLLVECAAARRARRVDAAPDGARPSVAVLVPAHDEERTLGVALAALRPALAAGDRLLVVADNCTDRTAEVARRGGADVAERTDPSRRGKGYALQEGIARLRASPPGVVIVVDADCEVAPGAIDALARACARTDRAAQASYRMTGATGSPIARFAFLVKNHVRPLGLARLGLPCQLSGTGMALPWRALERVRPDSGNIVEDLQLGADLALAGHAPVFVPEAVVASAFPGTEAAAAAQRTRWEHGHLQTIARMVPRLALGALRTRSIAPLALAADLAVPPLAFLALTIAAGFAVGAVLAIAGGGIAPLAVSAAAAIAVPAAIGLAWHRHARDLVSAREILGVPGYVARKLPIYARYVLRRQREWVRTDRDPRS